MDIISQFEEIVTKNLKINLSKYLNNILTGFDNPYDIDNYQNFIIDLDNFISQFSKDAYITFIKNLDDEFMNSSIRKQAYNSRGFMTKPLLTKFGVITFKRRRYESKLDKSSFTFVDRFLGLTKYSRLDPFVIAELVEESANNSYSKAGKIVSKYIGNKIKYNDDPNKSIISRATARNNVIKASNLIKNTNSKVVKDVEVLNIMLDEKFVGSQFNDGKDHMVKAAVVFETIKLEYKNRTRLVGKQVFGSINNDLLNQVCDYIYYNYDTDKLKKINFMGDGASWIKSFSFDSSFKYHKDIITKFGLDHFHLSQAIQHIVTNKHKDSFGKILKNYVIHDELENFISVCNSLINLEENRKETIENKMNYILNNWKYIQSSFKDIKYKCSMESNISHVFADVFTSRPKAYSKQGLNCLLKIRLLSINGYDLKKLYFEGLKDNNTKKKDQKIIDKVCINRNKIIYKYNDTTIHSIINPNLNLSYYEL